MRKPNPVESTLIVGALGAAALWLLGDTTTAIVTLVVEAIVWAVIDGFEHGEK
jgi:hypothetical protein